jgi:thymidylate kinase
MTKEFFIEAARAANKPDKIDQLKDTTEQVNDAMLYTWSNEGQRHGSEWSIFRKDTSFSTGQRLDPSEPTTIAAMWTGAVVNRSRRNYEEENGSFSGTNISFRKIWEATPLEALADRCEEDVSNLSPRLENRTTSVSIEKIKEVRRNEIQNMGREILIFVGPNGSGKDFMISHLANFLNFIKLDFDVHKMPNPDGILFPNIDQFLKGKKVLKPSAAQFLFFADAFDSEVSDGVLNIFNRHTAIEAMVYGPAELQTTILSTHPLINAVMHTMIIDRCPSTAQEAVHGRGKTLRVFEKNIEQVLNQRIRYAELTRLPGFRFINADFSGTDSAQKVRSVNRLLNVVLQTGIIQRQMVKTKVVNSFDEANIVLDKSYWDFKNKNNIWLDKEFKD